MKVINYITKNAFWFVSGLYVAIVVCSCCLPVFWDMYAQVKTAHFFLETDFKNLLPDGNSYSDNGHFPMYAIYLALLFKIFGFKLWVAHFSVLPFVLGLLLQLKKLSAKFLNEQKTFLVLLLTLAHPAILTQTIYFSNEIAIVFFSAWMINALLEPRSSHIALTSIFLCLLNLRGISFVFLLLIYFGLTKKQKSAYYLLSGMVIWIIWMLIHYYYMGWFLQGSEIKEFREITTLSGMLKNFLLCFWKLLDLGSVIGWIIIFISVVKIKKSNPLLNFLLLATLSVFFICVPLSNPISNRYFLLCYVLLLPAFVLAISAMSKRLFFIISFIFALVLIRNNWMSYPNKYGNAWDCSLKSIPYFDVRKQLDDYTADNKIARANVEAGFQLYFNDSFYLMSDSKEEYALLSDTEMPSKLYVADSNICNNYNSDREKYLLDNYVLEQKFEKGSVYINLYKRK